jgi:CRISPR type IV-associated protein Csf3
MCEPMKITAWLQCGVVSDWTLPIDSILYYQAARDRWGSLDVTIPGEGILQKQHGNLLPLKRVHAVQWYYCASFAQWSQPVAEGQDHWNKRFDQGYASLVDFGSKRGKVIVEAGKYKAYHMPVFYRHALNVSWYAVGRIDDTKRLLSLVTNIGKKPVQGWGRVLRWQVEPWPEDWSVYGPGGKLMRAIPSKDGSGILAGYRPSYWDRRNQAPCLMPESQ